MHGVISLPDVMSYDKYFFKTLSLLAMTKWKEFFEKVNFEVSIRQQKHEKIPSMQKFMIIIA